MFLADGRTIGYYILSFAQIISFCLHLPGANTNKEKRDIIMTETFLIRH